MVIMEKDGIRKQIPDCDIKVLELAGYVIVDDSPKNEAPAEQTEAPAEQEAEQTEAPAETESVFSEQTEVSKRNKTSKAKQREADMF